jgi:hypothetical protein
VQEIQVSSSVIQFSTGAALTLTPDQKWLLAASGLVTRERGSLVPASNCDEQQLRTLVEATAAGLVCSFCAAPKSNWRYPVLAVDIFPEAFVLPGRQLGILYTEWLACERCANLIARTDREALARISTECHFAKSVASVIDPDIRDTVEGAIRYIQDEFWGSLCGERERVPSFQPQT